MNFERSGSSEFRLRMLTALILHSSLFILHFPDAKVRLYLDIRKFSVVFNLIVIFSPEGLLLGVKSIAFIV